MLHVRELVVRELQLSIGDLRLDRLRLAAIGARSALLCVNSACRPASVCRPGPAALQRIEPLSLPRLFLLHLRQPIGEPCSDHRVRRHGGHEE